MENAAPTEWSSPDEGWALELRARITAYPDGDAAFLLSNVRDLALDDYGRVYVLDNQSHTIGVFDTTGAYVRTIGREGEGPGEFTGPVGMTWGPGGDLWISDPRTARYSVFDTAGELVRTLPRRLASWGWEWTSTFGPEGGLLEDDLRSDPASGERSRIAVRFDVSGDEAVPTDTFRLAPLVEDPPSFRIDAGNRMGYVQVPFTPRHRLYFDGRGGVWSGSGADFRLVRTELSGDTTRIVEWTGERPPVTAAELDDWRTGIEEDWGAGALRDLDLSRIPDRKPAYTQFFLDDRARVWVLRSEGAEANAQRPDTTTFDVIDPDGRWLGPVAVPAEVNRLVPPAFNGSWLAVATTGEMDLPSVLLFRIER